MINSNLKNVRFNESVFNNVQLFESDLSLSDFKGSKGLILNANNIEKTKFSPKNDEWNILRVEYTGKRFYTHFIFSLLFFIPLFFQVLLWHGFSVFESIIDVRSIKNSIKWEPYKIWELLIKLGSRQLKWFSITLNHMKLYDKQVL
jgi:uncharacterized protein YjbI with pentapeptide repeats